MPAQPHGNDYTAARTLLAQLRADDWLKRNARICDFSVYNANINRFCVVRLGAVPMGHGAGSTRAGVR